MTPEEIMQQIHADKNWHSWKCNCGCLNGRSNGNCGMCGGMKHSDDIFYGDNDYVVDVETIKNNPQQQDNGTGN